MEEWIRRDGEKKGWTRKENRQEEARIVEDILDMTRRKNKRKRERGMGIGWLVGMCTGNRKNKRMVAWG